MKGLRQNRFVYCWFLAPWWMLVCCCLAPLSVRSESGAEADVLAASRLELADGLYSRGMYAQAVHEYQRYLADHSAAPNADVLLYRLAESLRQTGKAQEAEKLFARVFAEYPESSYRHRAGYRRARIFAASGHHAAAADLLMMVLEETPPPELEAAIYYSLGDVREKTGNHEDALLAFRAVRARFPESAFYPYTLYRMAELLRTALEREEAEARARVPGAEPAPPVAPKTTDRYAQAIELYSELLRAGASDRLLAEANYRLGQLYFKSGRPEESSRAFSRLYEEYPDDVRAVEARLEAAWAAHHARRYADLVEICRQALVSESELDQTRQDEWLYLQGHAQRELLAYDEAATTYETLLTHYPESPYAPRARYELAVAFLRQERYVDAANAARPLEAVNVLGGDVYWILAEAYSGAGDELRAIQYYRLLVETFPRHALAADASYRLAYRLQQRGRYAESARLYLQLVEAFPTNKLVGPALFAAGVSAREAREPQMALAAWSRLGDLASDDRLREESLYQKAMLEIEQESFGEAQRSLQRLLSDFPQGRYEADARLWLGVAMSALNRLQDAKTELERAMDVSGDRLDLRREAVLQLGFLLQMLGEHDRATDLLYSLLETPQADRLVSGVLVWMAEQYITKQAWEKVLVCAEALAARRESAVWHQMALVLKGHALVALGHEEEAATVYANALDEDVTTRFAAEAAYALGRHYYRHEAYERSAGYYAQASRLAMDDRQMSIRADSYRGLGLCALAQNDPSGAARYFMSVAVLYEDPELVPECLYHAFRSFRAAGDLDAADKAAADLIRRYPDSTWATRVQRRLPAGAEASSGEEQDP